jgi:hypothetical protein
MHPVHLHPSINSKKTKQWYSSQFRKVQIIDDAQIRDAIPRITWGALVTVLVAALVLSFLSTSLVVLPSSAEVDV